MRINTHKLLSWIETQINRTKEPSGNGVSYDESVLPIQRETYRNVLIYLTMNISFCFKDIHTGTFFKFKEDSDKEAIFLKISKDNVVAIGKDIGKIFREEDSNREVIILDASFTECGTILGENQ